MFREYRRTGRFKRAIGYDKPPDNDRGRQMQTYLCKNKEHDLHAEVINFSTNSNHCNGRDIGDAERDDDGNQMELPVSLQVPLCNVAILSRKPTKQTRDIKNGLVLPPPPPNTHTFWQN